MNGETSTLQLNQEKRQKEPQNNDARKTVGTTGRLLNFFWQASRAWKLEFDGNSKMVNSRLVSRQVLILG